jgi:two-component system response regulator HydG
MPPEPAPAPPAPRPRVLVIEDDVPFLRTVSRILAGAGYEVVPVADPVEGLVAAVEPGVDVVVSDIQMPNLTGLQLLERIRARRPGVEVILMTGEGTVDAAVQAMKMGAYDYLTKPFDTTERLVLLVAKAIDRKRLWDRTVALQGRLEVKEGFEDLVGQSERMQEVFRMIAAVAGSPATVLVVGESGTGKELVARAIHHRSPRRDRPLVAVNCSALTETLLDSELFGHERGAFTGAVSERRGLFEAAEGGTLLLDEIGDVPPGTQVRLLRVLQEGEIRRVGAQQPRHVDVRVIAATHRDLRREVAEGRFREDLFFRLDVVSIRVPPLRERPEDVPPLAVHFLRKVAAKLGKRVEGIAPGAMEALTTYGWPGNVRELENAVERAVVLARGDELALGDLPPTILRGGGGAEVDLAGLFRLRLGEAKRLAVRAFERRYLASALRTAGFSVSRAAAAAGVDRSNFRKLLRQYGVPARPGEDDEGGAGSGGA